MAMPSSSNPNDWADLYQSSNNNVVPHGSSVTSSDEAAASMMFADQISSNTSSMPPPPNHHHHHHHNRLGAADPPPLGHHHQLLNPEGRVAKPARRRSRASKRTPTPVLNTDTKNFRAMVQQFTGGPHNHHHQMANNQHPTLTTPGGFMIPSGYHLSFQQQLPSSQQLNIFAQDNNNHINSVVSGYGNLSAGLHSSSSSPNNDHNSGISFLSR